MACVLLIACSSTKKLESSPRQNEFKYINQDGDVALWDLANQSISYSGGIIELENCTVENKRCLESDWVRIIAPKTCEKNEYYSNSERFLTKDGIRPLGLYALTGGIIYSEVAHNRFSYVYHPKRGIIKLTFIPPNLPVKVDSGFKTVPYMYFLENGDGPFPCLSSE